MNSDTENFLESLLFTSESNVPSSKNWSIHEFHPEFTAAVESFIDGFREHLATLDEACPDSDVYSDPDAGERSFGGNVYFSLSGHGCGFWDDRDSEFGDAMQVALGAYAGVRHRFEELDCTLAKFNGKIHLAYRTAAFRREYLTELFAPAVQPATA